MTNSLIPFTAEDLAAPAPAAGGGNVSEFVSQYLPVAERVGKRLNVSPEVLLGQWGLETGWGKSVVPGTNNLGNIKDFSGKGPQATDNQTGSRDAYRKYASTDEFGDDYASLIGRRYASAPGAGADAGRYFAELKRGGYAEDAGYVQKGVAASQMVRSAMTGGARASGGAASASGRDFYGAPARDDYIDIKAPPPGATAGDFAKELAGAAIDSVGSIGQMVGEIMAAGANKVTGSEDFEGKNLLAPASAAVRASMTDGGKQARRESEIRGDIADPSSIELPTTAQGWGMVLASGLGSLASTAVPLVGPMARVTSLAKAAKAAEAAGDLTKAARLVEEARAASRIATGIGAAAGAATTGGAAAEEVRANVTAALGGMSHEQLMKDVPAYAAAFAQGGDQQRARSAVVNGSAQWAAGLSAIAGAAGGALNAKVIEGMLVQNGLSAFLGKTAASRAGRFAVGSGGGAVAEGGQELAEKVGQNVGENIGLGRDAASDVTRNSAGDVIAGALVGGGVGAGSGATAAPRMPTNPAALPAAQKALEPNSPLSKAATAGTLAAEAAPAPARQADPILTKVAEIQERVKSGGLIDALRSAESPVNTKQFLNDLAAASSPSTQPQLREQALTRLEFAMGWADQNPALRPALNTAELPGVNVGGDAPQGPRPSAQQLQAGADREAALQAQLGAATTESSREQIRRELEANRVASMRAPAPVAAPADAGATLPLTEEASLTTSPGAAPAPTLEQPVVDPGTADAFDTGDLAIVTPTEVANDASMAAQERGAAQRRADADTATAREAQEAESRAAESPDADAVIAALKAAPFQRTADQKAVIARARATLSVDEMQLLDRAANQAFALTAADKVRVADLRKSPDRDVTQQYVSRETIEPPRAAVPAGGAPAFLRKRRAQLDQLAGIGFDTVERDGDGFVLRNARTGQRLRLDGRADAQLARAAIAARIDAAASRADTNPTDAQKEAGNYRKGEKFQLNGVNIIIENPRGSTRSGTAPDGTRWESTMAHHYGDVEGTTGADGDKVDVFVGPRPDSTKIYVIDQQNEDGTFDEHKVMMGFTGEDAARTGYLANYETGWTGLQAITEMTPEQFKAWVRSDAAQRPAAQNALGAIEVRSDGRLMTIPLVAEASLPASPARDGARTLIAKSQLRMLRRVATLFGKEIELFADPKGELRSDGFVRPGDTRTIFLNVRTTISPLAVFGHELMHLLRAELPEAYRAVADAVGARVTDAAGFRKFYGDATLSDEAALEELISDLNGDLMTDGAFWREVFDGIEAEHGAEAQGIIARLAALIYSTIDAAIKAFRGGDAYGSKVFIDDSKAVRAAFRDAMRAYAKDRGLTRTAMDAEVLRQSAAVARQQPAARPEPVLAELVPTATDDVAASRERDVAVGNRTDVTQLPAGKPIPEMAAIGGLEASLELARSKAYTRGRDLKLDLQERVLAAAGRAKVDLSERTLLSVDFLSESHQVGGRKDDVMSPASQPGFVITDKMRDELADGAPLFSRERGKRSAPRTDFAETEPAVRRASEERAQGWRAPDSSKFDSMVYTMQDKLVDTKRVVESVKAAGGELRDELDVYLQEELFHGRTAKRTDDFVHDELEPLVEEMREAGVTIEELDQFLHARHAREANAVIASRNPAIQDGGSGMLNQDAAAYMAELPADRRAALEAAAAKVDAMLKGTRALMVEYQLESAQKVQGWSDMFDHYVPLMREDDGVHTGGAGTGQGFSIKGKEVKSRTGSTRKVVDILANIAMQRERTIVRGEKNRVSRALVGLAEANPNPDFWQVDRVPTTPAFNPSTGQVENRADPMYKQRDNALVAKITNDDGEVIEHAVLFSEKDERAMRMAAALKNLDAAQLEGFLGASAKVTRYFASVNTQYNPVFGVVNLVRDVQDAMINLQATELKGRQAEVARNTLSALRGIYVDLRAERKGKAASSPWAQLWEEFRDVGGQTGYRQLFATSNDRAEAIRSALDPSAWMDSKLGKIFTANGVLKVPLAVAQRGAKWIFDWLSDYNEAMENGVRLAAYKAAIDIGMSKERAASLAKNLTVNFNRKGQAAQQAGALYAFFNASAQGTARMARTLFTMEPGRPKTIRLSGLGKKIVYGGMLLGTLQALALAAAGFGDDDPPEFSRNNNLIIPTGGKSYVSIPMPLGIRVIPAIGRITTEWALGGFRSTTKRGLGIAALFADSFNPIGNAGLSMQTIAPTAFDPLVALTENKDFSGRPIAKTSSNKAMPGHQLARDTATSWGKVIAEGINYLSGGTKYTAGVVSPTPDQIDYLIGQVTGGVGREVSKLEQTGLGLARGEMVPIYKVPLAGRFIGDAASQASEGAAFYANADHLNEIETEIKGLKKDGRVAEAERVRLKSPDAYLITQANQAELAVQKLRRQKSELIKAGAPRADVVALESKITARMASLNRAVEALKARAE